MCKLPNGLWFCKYFLALAFRSVVFSSVVLPLVAVNGLVALARQVGSQLRGSTSRGSATGWWHLHDWLAESSVVLPLVAWPQAYGSCTTGWL